MNALNITRKDLLILFKDRSTLLQLFVLPLVFIVLYVGIGGSVGAREAEETKRPTLPVVNQDDGEMATHLINNLQGQGGLNVESYSLSEAETKLAGDEISRYLVIPAGFSADVNDGTPASLTFKSANLSDSANQTVLLSVEGVAWDLSLQTLILGSLNQMRDMQAGNPEAEDALTANKAVTQAKSQFESSATRPLITVEEKLPEELGREENELSFAEAAVPAMTVLFVFLTAQTTAHSIFDEKKIGSFRRLLAAPMNKLSLMIGKLTPNFLLVILQVGVIFFAATVIFPLVGMDKMNLGNDIVALVLLILATALCSTALGALIISIARTEAQITGISTAALWVLAFLGGAIVPLFLVSDTLAAIGSVTPQYWAVTGFYDLLVRGQGMAEVTDSLLALLGFSVVFLAIALWRFDFD
jgi:ABC-2 type transport system permease protein